MSVIFCASAAARKISRLSSLSALIQLAIQLACCGMSVGRPSVEPIKADQLRAQFLLRVRAGAEPPRKITVEPVLVAGPVPQLVERRRRPFLRSVESVLRWQLDMIGARRIKSLAAADADNHAAVRQDRVRRLRPLLWRFFDGRRLIGRDAVHLRRMENGLAFQHDRAAVLRFRVIDFERLVKENRRRLLARADLPAFFLALAGRSSNGDRRS